jgi:hypothetical protein
VLRRRGAEDDEVGRGSLEACTVVRELLRRGEIEFSRRVLHARRLLVADPDDVRRRVLVHHAQQVAHVHVIEVDAGDSPAAGHELKGTTDEHG